MATGGANEMTDEAPVRAHADQRRATAARRPACGRGGLQNPEIAPVGDPPRRRTYEFLHAAQV